ncbi:hypothetical protein D9M68_19000 [compost metagenome]
MIDKHTKHQIAVLLSAFRKYNIPLIGMSSDDDYGGLIIDTLCHPTCKTRKETIESIDEIMVGLFAEYGIELSTKFEEGSADVCIKANNLAVTHRFLIPGNTADIKEEC